MRRQTIFVLMFVMICLTACNPKRLPANNTPTTIPLPTQNIVNEPVTTIEVQAAESGLVEYDCLNGEISPIAQSITVTYDNVTYEQIITWFCYGAEYEDILVALETEAMSDTSAEEMLQMLADGLTWDEIWFLVGIE